MKTGAISLWSSSPAIYSSPEVLTFYNIMAITIAANYDASKRTIIICNISS